MKPLRTRTSAAALGLLPLALPLAGGATTQDDGLGPKLTAVAEAERGGADGLVVVVEMGGEPVFARGWGRLPGGGLAAPDALLRGEAVLEPLVAIAALQWATAAGVALDAPLSKHLEGVDLGEKDVDLVEVLGHTSGLSPFGALAAADGEGPAALLARVAALGPETDPGTCFDYSESNGLMAGVLAAGEGSVRGALEKGVFAALELEGTSFAPEGAPPAASGAGRAHEFAGRLVEAPALGPVLGAGGLCTTAADLARIAGGLADGTLVNARTFREVVEERRLAGGAPVAAGLGVMLTAVDRIGGFSFGGAAEGVSLHVAHYPTAELTIVCAATGAGSLVGLERDLARTVLGMPLQNAPEAPLTDEEVARYAGQYQLGCSSLIVAKGEGDTLTLGEAGSAPRVMVHRGAGSFVQEDDDEVHFRFVVPEGEPKATVLQWFDHGRYAEAVRMN